MFARLLMFAFIVSCASHESKAVKTPNERLTVIEHRGIGRRI